MKKLLSILLCAAIIVSIASISFTADAAGWLSYARGVQLNSVFSDEFSGSDYHYYESYIGNHYYDAFRFTVPAKGKISLRIESEDEDVGRKSEYAIFNSANIDKSVWENGYWGSNKTDSGYSSGRGVYYDEWSIALSAGTYYLVASAYDDYMNITFDYSLTYKPTFANTSISSKSAKSKGFKVSWKKASGVTGYQIQYSLKSNMKSSKKVTIKKSSTTAKTIKKLKAKKKYYVRVRTYKKMKVEGVNHTYYGKWSAKKTIKTKK